jgi:hypothetical protein
VGTGIEVVRRIDGVEDGRRQGDAGTELIDPRLGVIETRCPHCQGYLEAMPLQRRVDVGYLVGPGKERFDVALSLAFEGLEIERADDLPRLMLRAAGRGWEYRE